MPINLYFTMKDKENPNYKAQDKLGNFSLKNIKIMGRKTTDKFEKLKSFDISEKNSIKQ